MPVRLVFETHATTVDNEIGVATGWLPGELSPTGIANAADLGRRRRDDGIDLVVTSDLQRAMQTVAVAFDGGGPPVLADARLREVDYGALNGASVDQVHAQRRQRVDEPFPGGGQSYRDVVRAVADLLAELRRDRDGQRVLLVGHAATRFALDHLLTARPLEAAVAAPFAWQEGWEYLLTDQPPVLEVLDGAAARSVVDELEATYRAAFTAPGYDETEEQVQRFSTDMLPLHATRDGFRLVLVREAGTVRGFGYGFTGQHGFWWTERLKETAPPGSRPVLDAWLGGHFEVVLLGVDPVAQGRGFGRSLMEALLLDQPHERALLSTYADDRPAPRLYARLGWQRLVRGVLDGDSDLWGLDRRDRRGVRPGP
jgi:broad specificity phosphatase PhoE/GNAT superfamily N-acetyltransferase